MKIGLALYRHMLPRDPAHSHDILLDGQTFIDEGDVDTIPILSILHRNRFDGVVIPDSTPQMTCSAPWHAGMAHTLGFMLAAKASLKSPQKLGGELSAASHGDK
jgi:hypothetical protein